MNWNDTIIGAPNFTFGEFFVTSQNQALLRAEYLTLPAHEQAMIKRNLEAVAARLQSIRDFYGKPIKISSGWRSERVNKAVGGASGSYHRQGMAADFTVSGIPVARVQADFDGWNGGLEKLSSWVHLDIGPKRRFTP